MNGRIKLWERDWVIVVFDFFDDSEVVNLQSVCKDWYNEKVPIALSKFKLNK